MRAFYSPKRFDFVSLFIESEVEQQDSLELKGPLDAHPVAPEVSRALDMQSLTELNLMLHFKEHRTKR